MAWWEVAAGDGAGHYHPRVAVRRDQLASMLVRLLGQAGQPPEPAEGERFEDLGGNVHADNVEALAAMGVIRGVGGSRFAPGRAVRRDQMASLLVRAHEAVFDELPRGADDFEDTGGNVHEEAIGKLAAAGVTTGTGESTDRYGPAGEVTRAQLASFTMRLLALWVDEGLAAVTGEDDPDVEEGDAVSHSPSVSASGRWVAFASQATNLVAQDTGGAAQVYVRDRASGETGLVSVDSGGRPAEAGAGAPAISGDGRQVAFVSAASNLADGDDNDTADVFVHDRVSGVTERVSVSTAGAAADGASGSPAVSADGQRVAFVSVASNLVSDDTNEAADVFVHDRASGATDRVSVSPSGGQADGPSGSPAMSGDGRLVVFASEASNLVADDTNEASDVFVRDRAEAATERVSVTSGGAQAGGPSRAPSISPNGDYVAYETAADDLASAATNPDTTHVMRRDRAEGRTLVATHDADGPSHSAAVADDGRVAFTSAATNLTPDWDHNGHDHVYEWNDGRSSVQLSVDDGRQAQANARSHTPSISANGFVVAFTSSATNLVAPTTSGVSNVFVHRWVGRLCLAALVSGPGSRPDPDEDPPREPPPPGTDDDDERTVTIYREVDGKHNSKGVYNKAKLSPAQFRLDTDGVSMLERQSLQGAGVYIVPFEIVVEGRERRPGQVGYFRHQLPGTCETIFKPEPDAFFHWNALCEPRDSTPQQLSTAAKQQEVAERIECNESYRLPEGRTCTEPHAP